VKRAEKAQIAEDLEFELLPKSFCVQKKQQALLDTINKRLIINTSSANQALQLTGLLRKSIPGMTIEPLTISENLALKFAQWINTPEVLPEDFQLASDCLLFSLHDEHKRIHCKGYELPSEEIVTLLAQDMATAEISLVWKERIQFTLTHDFVFKKLKSLDYLSDDFSELKELDEEYQRQDAALTLLSGELRALVDALNSLLTPNHQANEVTTEQQIPLLV
jgi:recombination associated protein RdgC